MEQSIGSDDDIRRARERGERAQKYEPRVKSVIFDSATRELQLTMVRDARISLAVSAIAELAGLTDSAIARVEVSQLGRALRWDVQDIDIAVAGLVRDFVGWPIEMQDMEREMRRSLAQRAGSARSEKKAKSSAANGALGGRPAAEVRSKMRKPTAASSLLEKLGLKPRAVKPTGKKSQGASGAESGKKRAPRKRKKTAEGAKK